MFQRLGTDGDPPDVGAGRDKGWRSLAEEFGELAVFVRPGDLMNRQLTDFLNIEFDLPTGPKFRNQFQDWLDPFRVGRLDAQHQIRLFAGCLCQLDQGIE